MYTVPKGVMALGTGDRHLFAQIQLTGELVGGGCLVDVGDPAAGVDEAVPVGGRVARVPDEVDEGVGQRRPADLVHQRQAGLEVVH